MVKHKAGEYVSGRCHTNTLEGFWSHLKRKIVGIHHSVSKKHLQLYVDSQTFRYNTREISESARFDLLLQNMEHRVTYKELTKKAS